MDNQAVVDQIVQSLSFEVEAVPKSKTKELTSSSINTPLNVKIRVRKKDDLTMRRGVISIPKFDDPERTPQKIRLVNSDLTIMSFDVFMEAEFEKKPLRKPRKHIFDMLKPGICLGASEDDDYPYLPSSSYSANVTEDNTNSGSDGVLKHNFTLSKNTYDEYCDPTKGKKFLGKCKPGGCLDPPFDEDKYSYKPVIKRNLSNEENSLKKEIVQDSDNKSKERRSSFFDSGIFKKKRKTSDQSTGTRGSSSIKGNQSNSILNLYQVESTVNSLSTTQSNSIITYPPALASSELPISDERNRSRMSSEDKSRNSFNEFTDTYFISPKGINKKKDKNKDNSATDDNNSTLQEIDKDQRKSKPVNAIKIPMPIPIPVPVPIPIKSKIIKQETAAPDVEKANVDDIVSKLSDRQIIMDPENDIIDIKIPRTTDLSQEKVEKEEFLTENSNVMEAKYATIDDFDKIKQDFTFDNDSKQINLSRVSITSQHLSKQQKEEPPNRNASIESHTKDSPQHSAMQIEEELLDKNVLIEEPLPKNKPENILKQELSKHEIPEVISLLIEDNVEIMDKAENAIDSFQIDSYETQSKILFPINNTFSNNQPTDEVGLEENGNNNENINTQKEEDKIDSESSESKFSQKSHSLSESQITKRQDADLESSNIYQNDEEIMTSANDTEGDKNIKVGDIAIHGDNDNELLESYNAVDDLLSQSADRSSQIDRPIEDDSDIIKQLQSPDNKENLELTAAEMINKDHSYITALAISDTAFRKLGSVDSETNLVGEHNIDIGNKEEYDEDETKWIAALITGGTEGDKNIKVGDITFHGDNDNELLESYNAVDDLLSQSADISSQIDRLIEDDSDIIKRLQSPDNKENFELSTAEIINEDHSNITALAISDIGFRKFGSVDSETNLVGEHNIDIGNKKEYDEDETKAALRTGGTEWEDDHDSSASASIITSTKDSASPSIIKSTDDKGIMSPDKSIAQPMYNTVSTETITKKGEAADESGVSSNELDKKLSNSKSYVGSASVSSSIPSTSTLKSVLKKETVAVDLAFHSYLNEKNERFLKTFDTITEPKRYLNDSITLVKSQVRLSANEIRIPIDSENDMFIQIKKASVNQHVHISESELDTDAKHHLKSADSKYPHDIIDRDFLHDSLLEIYDQELVPLQMVIKALKDEIDVLASQQMVFREKVFSPKKIKAARVGHSNRRCGCLKKIN